MTKNYDPRCLALAIAFLEDYDQGDSSSRNGPTLNEDQLASEIQCAIEDWLNESGLPLKEHGK